MSEVFTESPTRIIGGTSSSTIITTTQEDLERQGTSTVDKDLDDVTSEHNTSPVVEPQSIDHNNDNNQNISSTTTKKQASSFFHYTNIVTLMIVISMFIAAIYGILEATGAFDQNDNKAQQDNLANNDGENNVVSNVCDFSSNNVFDIRGDGSLLLRQYINTGENTVTVQLEYNDIGWIAMAFSESTLMIPNTAIIALPDQGMVQKYTLSSRSLAGVIPFESNDQTLLDATVVQEDGRTIMTFTKKLIESGEVEVIQGTNQFNWAIGSSNTLAFHASRGTATLKFDLCLEAGNGNNNNNGTPVAAPIGPPTPAPVLMLPTDVPIVAPTYAPVVAPMYDATIPAPVSYSY